jgi:hypothetical protein
MLMIQLQIFDKFNEHPKYLLQYLIKINDINYLLYHHEQDIRFLYCGKLILKVTSTTHYKLISGLIFIQYRTWIFSKTREQKKKYDAQALSMTNFTFNFFITHVG